MGGARRLVLSGIALTALLAVVALASHAHRPGGSPGGGSGEGSKLLFEYGASMLAVIMVLGALVVVWIASLRRRHQLLTGGSRQRRQLVGLLAVCLLAIPAAFVVRHFTHYDSPLQQTPATTTPAAPGRDAPARQRPEAEFQWLPALVLASLLLAGGGGAIALVFWKRHAGEAWKQEASLAAALDEVLADTLDDLRAERDPRRAVIRVYARMEQTFAAYDVARDPAETPHEYVDRALDRLGVSTSSTRRVTALYERAKFSPHAIDAPMKDDAIDALAALRAELEAEGQRAA